MRNAREDAAIEALFRPTSDGWIFRVQGWIAPSDRPWILQSPRVTRAYVLNETQKTSVATIMRRYGRLLSGAVPGGMLASAVLFLLGLWSLALSDLTPLRFMLAVVFGLGSLVLVLTLAFIALRIDRHRDEMRAVLAGAQSAD
jgi:hypothetical protein